MALWAAEHDPQTAESVKIGILTLPLRHNYGGILQAYALQTVIRDLGCDAHLIRLSPHLTVAERGVVHLKNAVKWLTGRTPRRCLSERALDEVVYRSTNYFIGENIKPATRIIESIGALRRLDREERYDAYVVGSDQVWRREYTKRFERAYSVAFTKRNVVRVAYAASFGVGLNARPRDVGVSRDALQKFAYVSTREESGAAICKNVLGVDADVVLDPTMLLDRSRYEKFAAGQRDQWRGGLFEYFLDRTAVKNAVSYKIQKSLNVPVFALDVPNMESDAPLEALIMKPVEEWIQCFRHASYIVTDSFHGCVFAIIFNKPFSVLPNLARGGDRFQTLLQRFELTHRIIDASGNPDLGPIDWGYVNSLLGLHAERSKARLAELLQV